MSNPTTRNGAHDLDEYDVAFLEYLKAEGDTILGECASREARDTFKRIVEEYAGEHSIKNALYAADRARVEMISPEELRAEAPGLYRRFCAEREEDVDPNDPAMQQAQKADEVIALRARLLEILRALHWSYTFGPLREKLRTRLIIEAMIVMLVATGVLGAVLTLMRYIDDGKGHPFIAVLATVVYAGVMGGVASCMQRLSAVPTKGDALGSIYALKNSRYVLYFAPLSGAVFAVIAMLLFMGQVLKGVIFPEFAVVPNTVPADGEWVFTHLLLPNGSANYALLFLWSFIAGFAERFVPDELTELARRASPGNRRAAGQTMQTGRQSAESGSSAGRAAAEPNGVSRVASSSGNGDAPTAQQHEVERVPAPDSAGGERAEHSIAAAVGLQQE